MGWVMDGSTALAWALPDEDSDAVAGLLGRISEGLWVPALWWYEIANALASAQRQRRISEADGARAVELLGALPVKTDGVFGSGELGRLRSLALEHGLSAYDCAYLELAQRKGLALATLDARLAAAARKTGVELIRKG